MKITMNKKKTTSAKKTNKKATNIKETIQKRSPRCSAIIKLSGLTFGFVSFPYNTVRVSTEE